MTNSASPQPTSSALPTVKETNTFFHILFKEPFICVISSGDLFETGVLLASSLAAGRTCHILVQPAWHLIPQMHNLARRVTELKAKNPSLDFTVMCTTLVEFEAVKNLNLNALHIHKNAFLDEKIFNPGINPTKKYSAVHIANVEPFKRHWLAFGIPNLALITYSYREGIANTEEISGYKNIAFSNFDPKHPEAIKFLKPQVVADVVRASHCGVILSEVEGANNASTEYLMCGIPVVSTPSKGGRDEFFDSENSRIVQPLPEAVEAAVTEFNEMELNPAEIHFNVMKKIRVHRARLLEWLEQMTGNNLFEQADENLWIPQFTNKLRQTVRLKIGIASNQ